MWLGVEKAVPIYEDAVWNQLSFTKGQTRGTPTWTGRVRTSLVQLSNADGRLLESLLLEQSRGGRAYPLDPADSRKLATHRVRRQDKDVTVTVPEDRDEDLDQERAPKAEVRESIQIQALLAEIGARMGMHIWVPRADRAAVVTEWRGDHPPPLERLPLNYDETTLRTIEQIDILWLKGRSIRRAFEVEHTTSVYSGILRMADRLPCSQTWRSVFISLRRWLGGRRYSKNCGGPCFRFWSAVRCSRAAPISRTTVYESWRSKRT